MDSVRKPSQISASFLVSRSMPGQSGAGFPGEKITEASTGCGHVSSSMRRWARASPMAGRACHRRWYSHARMHRGECALAGPLCGPLPGSRGWSGRRAGGAHGRRPHTGRVWRSDRAGATYCLRELYSQRVRLEGLILKPNMVLPGSTCATQENVDEIARRDRRVSAACCARRGVPGVAFLSGGQSGELASARLNAMNVRFKTRLPWALAFFLRSRHPGTALQIWHGDPRNVVAAQEASTIERGAIARHGWANTMQCWSATIARGPCPNLRLVARGGLM